MANEMNKSGGSLGFFPAPGSGRWIALGPHAHTHTHTASWWCVHFLCLLWSIFSQGVQCVIPVPAAASFIESWSHSLSSSFIIRAKVVRQLSFQSPMTLHAGMLRWSSLESGERERRFAASSPPSIYICVVRSLAGARVAMVGWLAVRSLGPTTPSVRPSAAAAAGHVSWRTAFLAGADARCTGALFVSISAHLSRFCVCSLHISRVRPTLKTSRSAAAKTHLAAWRAVKIWSLRWIDSYYWCYTLCCVLFLVFGGNIKCRNTENKGLTNFKFNQVIISYVDFKKYFERLYCKKTLLLVRTVSCTMHQYAFKK